MSYADLAQAFEQLSPTEKATFIDARLDWATNGALCGEMTQRLCHPTEDNSNISK